MSVRQRTQDRPTSSKSGTDTKEVVGHEKAGLFSLLGFSIVFSQIICEVTKQTSNYSLQYFLHGAYPVPQTIIVVVNEIIKLAATILRAKGRLPSMSLDSLKASTRFLVPSVIYAINNNIYYAGLTLVPPPIWLILCSARTVVTASVYKFVLKRQVTFWQFMGAILIVVSIGIAKIPDILSASSGSGVNAVPATAIILALIASCNSVGAAVYTEQLFKSDRVKGETFLDQQFWLYFYGGLVAGAGHFIANPGYTPSQFFTDVQGLDGFVQMLLVVAMTFSSLGGLAVASILKYLDNIVKDYTGSVANILTALVSSYLFPDKFQFTPYVILSMMFLIVGIYLYETMKKTSSSVKNEDKTK